MNEAGLVLAGLRRIRAELTARGPGSPVILTGELAAELQEDHQIPAEVFAHVMRGLVADGRVEAVPVIGSQTEWHVTSIRD